MKKGYRVSCAVLRPIRIGAVKRLWPLIFMAPLVTSAMEFSEAEKLIKSYDSATRNYLYERMASESGLASEEKKACADLPGGGVTQVLRINQDGVIDLIISNVQNPQSECFEKIYMGRAFKAPPNAPVYIKQKLGYGASK